MAAIVISSNTDHVWTMHLCMDFLKFVSGAPGAKTLNVAILSYSGTAFLWQFANRLAGGSITQLASKAVYKATFKKWYTKKVHM